MATPDLRRRRGGPGAPAGPEIGARLIVVTPRRRNDRGGPPNGARARPHSGARRASTVGSAEWLWGWHAVLAAITNPNRDPARRILATEARARALARAGAAPPMLEIMTGQEIAQILPPGAVHQGLAADLPALEPTPLTALALPAVGMLVMLDQVTDPQNVGAIFRSAAAFGARGVILQERHAPPLAGALAKASAGAVDGIAHARETNLARTIERLAELGWRAVGLASEAAADIAETLDGGPTVLVLGSEGEGLRRLVRERCDLLARIPMAEGAASLNVSAAAAIALYQARLASEARLK